MTMADRVPDLDDKALANLLANAKRLSASGTAEQQNEANAIVPLVEAEMAARKAAAPPRAVRRTPGTAKAAPKAAAPRKSRAKAKA